MSLISKALKTGVLVGAAYAAVKVSEKMKENRINGTAAQTPAGKAEEIKLAASEVFAEAKQIYDEKAPGIKDTVNSGVIRAADVARTYAPGALSKVHGAVQTVADKAQVFADTLADEPTEADFVPVDSQPEEKAKQEPLDPVEVEKH